MSAPAVLATVQCSYCTRWQFPYRVHVMANRQVLCDDCLAHHFEALLMLGGDIPKGCQQCGLTWDELTQRAGGIRIRMYGVPKDGILQLLCAGCIEKYTPKRKELYKGTEYGRNELKV